MRIGKAAAFVRNAIHVRGRNTTVWIIGGDIADVEIISKEDDEGVAQAWVQDGSEGGAEQPQGGALTCL